MKVNLDTYITELRQIYNLSPSRFKVMAYLLANSFSLKGSKTRVVDLSYTYMARKINMHSIALKSQIDYLKDNDYIEFKRIDGKDYLCIKSLEGK